MKFVAPVIWVVVGITIGLLGGYFGRGLFTPRLDPSISLMDGLNAIATLSVALIFGGYLSSKSGKERVEKDMLIEAAKEVRLLAAELRSFITRYVSSGRKAAEPRDFLRRFKTLQESAQDLGNLSTACFAGRATKESDRLLTLTTDCHRAATGGFPFRKMDATEFSHAERAFTELNQALTAFIVHVNRL